jgi:hypothetical protein
VLPVSNDDFVIKVRFVNNLVYCGVPVYWSQSDFMAGGESYSPGDFIIPIMAPCIGWRTLPPEEAEEKTMSIAEDYPEVELIPVEDEFNAEVKVLNPVEIAIYGDHVAQCYAFNGLFNAMGFKAEIITGEQVKAGILEEYDIFAIPGDSWPQTYSLGEVGCNKVKEFITNGGGLIASCAGGWTTAGQAPNETWPQKSYLEVGRWYMWNVNTSWPFASWGDKYYTPAGIGILTLDNENPDHPVMFGLPESFNITHWQGPMFKPVPVDRIQWPEINETAFTVEWEDQILSNPIPFASFSDWTVNFTFYEYYGDIEAQRSATQEELEDTWLGRAIDEGILSIIGGYMGVGKVVVAGSHPELGRRLSLGDQIDLPSRIFANALLWEGSKPDFNPVSFPVEYGLEKTSELVESVEDLFDWIADNSPDLPTNLTSKNSTFGKSNQEKWEELVALLPSVFDRLEDAIMAAEDTLDELYEELEGLNHIEEYLMSFDKTKFSVDEELNEVRELQERVIMAIRMYNEDINYIYPEEWTPADDTPPRVYAGACIKMGALQNLELMETRLTDVKDGLITPAEWPTYIWGVDSLLGGYGLHNFISRCIGYLEGNNIIAEIVMDEVGFASEEL